MIQFNNHPQLTRLRNTYREFKRSTILIFKRLRCHNAKDEERQSRSTTANIGSHESHAEQALDMSVGGPRGPEGSDGSNVRPLLDKSVVEEKGSKTHGSHSQYAPDISVSGQGTVGLESLKEFVLFDAQFDSSAQDPRRRCHPGTRENVLKKLRGWFDNPHTTERISWLRGPVGVGKSAIAQTIAQSYERPKIAATFFFRPDIHHNDGNRLLVTLAYQLALSIPVIRDHISICLSERPDLPRTNVETQFEQLLMRLFQVLSEDAAQQLAPAAHVIAEIVKKYQAIAPVVLIDGIDACMDENLQRRFLKVIGDAVADNRFPLRFLIVSRPEYYIEHTIRRFKKPILTIDLAKLDDADRDIEKYLADEFFRIASEQDLDPTWPGQDIIKDIVYKSSGNFIFAFLVIKFVGDQYCFPKTQLEIVLNMKLLPPNTTSPFAPLDRLFLEILERVPNQDFLKRYLPLLTARIDGSNELNEDDATLMYVSEEELLANLRRMRSILKFEHSPRLRVDVHHRSFLDFLHDSSRSGQYYINKSNVME